MYETKSAAASALTLTTQSTYNAYISIPPSSIGFFPHFKPKAAQKYLLYTYILLNTMNAWHASEMRASKNQ